MHDRRHASWIAGVALLVPVICIQAACSENPPPVLPDPFVAPMPIDDPPEIVQSAPPPAPVPPPPPAVPILSPDEEIASQSLEALNRALLLEPVFFVLDSSELDERGRGVVEANADLLARFPTWNVTIEGHCDERGTPEYNLGLGERRALAAQRYLLELGARCGACPHRQLRKGVSVRSRKRRCGVGREPAGALRDYAEVADRRRPGYDRGAPLVIAYAGGRSMFDPSLRIEVVS